MQCPGFGPIFEVLKMISLPEGFDLSLFIGDIVTYIGIPIVTIAFSFCIFRLITYSMSLGSKN
jgi:hypothetical protein